MEANCWKVLDVLRNSAWLRGPMERHYPLNARIDAKIGGFLVFKTKAEARDWAESIFMPDDFLVVGARGDGRVRLPKMLYGNFDLTEAQAIATWEGTGRGGPWPKGTIAFKSITCLE